MPLNPYQRKVADVYGGGDYAHLETVDECRDVGDSLFTFLIIELATGEGCEDEETAIQRLENARDDVQAVLDAFV